MSDSRLSDKTTAELEKELKRRKAKNIDSSPIDELLKKEKETLKRLKSEAECLDKGVKIVFPLCQFNIECIASWSHDFIRTSYPAVDCVKDDMQVELRRVTTTANCWSNWMTGLLIDCIEAFFNIDGYSEEIKDIPVAKKILAPFCKRVKSFINECTKLSHKYNLDIDEIIDHLEN